MPVVVLAQAWRSGPQAHLSQLLRGCRVQPDDEHVGGAADAACARSGTTDVVDAVVVVSALCHDALVVTSDPEDLAHLADTLGRKVQTYAVWAWPAPPVGDGLGQAPPRDLLRRVAAPPRLRVVATLIPWTAPCG